MIEVNATNGDTFVGGRDFDERLVIYCFKKFREQYGQLTTTSQAKSYQAVRQQCERVKCWLSEHESGVVEVPNITPG